MKRRKCDHAETAGQARTEIRHLGGGEESGELPAMLRSLAKLYEDTGRQRMTRFLLLLEPAAILFIARRERQL